MELLHIVVEVLRVLHSIQEARHFLVAAALAAAGLGGGAIERFLCVLTPLYIIVFIVDLLTNKPPIYIRIEYLYNSGDTPHTHIQTRIWGICAN